MVVSNLAVALAGLSRQVVVADLDLEAPRLHALFGVERPDTDVARATGIRHVQLWPGAARVAAAEGAQARTAIIHELGELDADVVIVDVGAANREDLWDFFAGGASRILVTTRDDAALEATFAFLKSAAVRAARKHGERAPAVLAQFTGGLLGNLTAAPEEAETFHAFARIVREELGIPLTALACFNRSQRISQSVADARPLLDRHGLCDEVRAFHQVAELILSETPASDADCALDGPSAEVPVEPLPIALGRYERRHPRFPVDWAARLVIGHRVTEVRVRDVSEAGAALETTLRLRIGDEAILHFAQLPHQPALPVTVRNVVPALGRVGVGFTGEPQAVAPVVGAARARLATP